MMWNKLLIALILLISLLPELAIAQPLIDAFVNSVGRPIAEGIITAGSIIYWSLTIFFALLALEKMGEMSISGIFRGLYIADILRAFKWPLVMIVIPLILFILSRFAYAYADAVTGFEHDLAIVIAQNAEGLARVIVYSFLKIGELFASVFGG